MMQPTSNPTTTAQDFLSNPGLVTVSNEASHQFREAFLHDRTAKSLAKDDGGKDAKSKADELR